MIKSMLNSRVELKRSVVAFTGLTTSTAGSITPITQGIVQGDTVSTRDGNQLLVMRLVVRHNLVINTGVQCSQRVIIFWDNQANAAQPVVTDVLDSASFITGFNIPNAQSNRFHILHDEFIVTSLNGANSGVDHVWTFPLHHKVTYTGTTNVATANGKGAMYILYIADNANALFGTSLEVSFTDA
jgi:hypothetical protein